MHKLVLLRHGESKWNLQNMFTGWTDVDLTEKGIADANSSGKLLKDEGFIFDLIYTSVLKRAIRTVNICVKEMRLKDIPIEDVTNLYEGKDFSFLKKDLAELAVEKIQPINEEINKLMEDQLYLDNIMTEGKHKATKEADSVLNKVYEIVGLQKS